MPTYEYLCRECGTRLEVIQSFSDDSLTVCDDCGGELRKVFSAAGLIFKGSGWHIKDYSGAGPSGGSSDAKGSPSPKESGSDATKKSGDTKDTSAAPAAASSGGSSSSSGSSGSSGSSSGSD